MAGVDCSSFLVGSELSVIVPAFNEVATIAAVLRQLHDALPEAEVIVVDDGSTDGTADESRPVAESLNARVERLDQNSGKGSAVRRGLAMATRKWVVIQDSDLEYQPQDLKELLSAVVERDLSVVYGSRYKVRGHAQGSALLNYLGVQLLAILVWLLYGRRLSDPHTCYKMLRRDLFQSLDIRSIGFELCAEINSKLLRRGIDIPEIPISYQPRNAAAGKKIRLRDFFIAAWTYVRYRFGTNNTSTSGANAELAKSKPIYLISRVLIGCLLLVAGVTKLSPLSALPIATWLVLPKVVVFIWGVVEFILGWACLTFVPHRLLRHVLAGLFSLFLVVLAVQWFNGEERCQCLGSLSVPVGIMVAIDLLTLLSLLAYRREWERPLSRSAGFFSEQVANLRIVLPGLLLVGIAWFGSLDAARAYLAGDAVLVDSFSKFAGEVRLNDYVDISFRLLNPTSSPVRVLGAKASCSCIAILDLPTTVEPGSEKEIRLRVRGRTADTLQRESAELMFDDSALRMVLNATAIVRPNR